MTQPALEVLQVLADGEARTVQQVQEATGRCGRMTRAALRGCVVATLAEADPGPPVRYWITDEGRIVLADYGLVPMDGEA